LQIFFVACEDELKWSTIEQINPWSTHIYEQMDLGNPSTLFDRREGMFVEDSNESEAVDIDKGNACS